MKNLRILATLWLTLSASFVQCQSFQWSFGAGSFTDDTVIGIEVDNDGNVYASGHLNSGTTIGNTTFDSWGAYIFKSNADGNVEWARSFGSFNTYGIDIAIDSEKNIYLLGSYGSPIEIDGFQLASPGGGEFVLKLDHNGNAVWLKDYGYLSGNAIEIDRNDNIYIAGNFSSDLVFEGVTYAVRGREGFDNDLLILKLDSEGIFQWIRTPGSRADEYLYDMDIDDSGLVVVGYMGSTTLETSVGDFTTPRNELGLIMKYDFDGSLQWFNSFDAPQYSECHAVTLDENGEAFVSGLWSEGSQDFMRYIFVSKVRSDGEVLNNIFISDNASLGSFVSGSFGRQRWDVSASGRDVYLTAGLGGTRKIGPLDFVTAGSRDAAIIKLNEVGFPQWLNSAMGTGNDEGLRVVANGNAVYMAGNYSSLELSFDDYVLDNNSGNRNVDFFVSKVVDNSNTNQCPEIESFTVSHVDGFCTGDSVLLLVTNEYATYAQWELDGNDLGFDDKKQIYVKEPGTYQVTLNADSRCPVPPLTIQVDTEENQDENTDIVIHPLPEFSIERQEPFCIGESLNLQATFSEEFDYKWDVPSIYLDDDLVLTESTLSIQINAVAGPQTFYLTVQNTRTGCLSVDSLNLDITADPVVSLDVRERNLLTARAENATLYKWFYENIELPEFRDLPSIQAVDGGEYFVIVENLNGCSAVSSTVFVEELVTAVSPDLEFSIYPNPTQDFIHFQSGFVPEKIELIDMSGGLVMKEYNNDIVDVRCLKPGAYILNVHRFGKKKSIRFVKV